MEYYRFFISTCFIFSFFNVYRLDDSVLFQFSKIFINVIYFYICYINFYQG